MKNYLYLILFIMSGHIVQSQKYQYPQTKTVDASDTYFGITYKDPYRWLENVNTPEVDDWFKQQADYTNSILSKISGKEALKEEWIEIDKKQEVIIGPIDYINGRLFYFKKSPGEKVKKLYYREGLYTGNEVLLFDPLAFKLGKTYSITDAVPCPDGKKIIINYQEGGSEVNTMNIMDVATKQFIDTEITPVWGPQWTFDGKAVIYGTTKNFNTNFKDINFGLNTKTMLHIPGNPKEEDKDVFSNESYPMLQIAANEAPSAWVERTQKKYLFAGRFTVQAENFIYYAPISKLNEKIEWKILCQHKDSITGNLVYFDDDVYAMSHKNAPYFKVLRTSLKNPNWDNAEQVFAEMPGLTLLALARTKDYLVANYSDGINAHIYKYNVHTKQKSTIKLPYSGTAFIGSLPWESTISNNAMSVITSWNKPRTEFQLSLDNDIFFPSKFNKTPNYPEAYKNLVVEEVEVKGHDGAMIPLSIIYKKGLKMDGNNVCMMEGYGAYGYAVMPDFSTKNNSLAVRDVVIAIPHVRGGNEKGQSWYQAGFKTTKPNTWKDFISCAEFLIKKGYTSSKKLAGTGTSAGGIMISRAITERPDLFAAAVCNVGCANAMRLEFGANGPANTPEFGTIADSVECKALFEMDGVQHIKAGVKYPAILGVGGFNDPRVMVWQPGKFIAAAQNASSSDKPILLKINYDNGHFTEDREVTYANFADQLAFMMWQCGHKDFQIKSE
ncbi:MAG: serine protease, peptidase S9 family protein [Chitinophagaceae bacterium]|nr:MAG: serine protease, peptidase S9 family protein [Chitinophagaceae bacterium]